MTLLHETAALALLTSAAACAVGAVCTALPYRRRIAGAEAWARDLETQIRSVGQAAANSAQLAEARERKERRLTGVRLPVMTPSLSTRHPWRLRFGDALPLVLGVVDVRMGLGVAAFDEMVDVGNRVGLIRARIRNAIGPRTREMSHV